MLCGQPRMWDNGWKIRSEMYPSLGVCLLIRACCSAIIVGKVEADENKFGSVFIL